MQLAFFDVNLGNSLGATVFVNLRSDSITGTVLGTTESVSMPDGFGRSGLNAAASTFFFAATIDLQPGVVYYLEPIVQTGDQWGISSREYFYFGGMAYANGVPFSGSDLWFREGTYSVPEPSTLSLFGLGLLGLVWHRWRKRQSG